MSESEQNTDHFGGSPLDRHRWGVWPALDRIWCQVAGFAGQPWRRVFMVLQACIDDSYTKDGTFVLAGYIATAEAWAEFTKEWSLLVPFAPQSKQGVHRFKMAQMAPRMTDVIPFYRVIERHVALSIWCKIDIGDLRRAVDRLWVPNALIDLSIRSDPFAMSYLFMLDAFHKGRCKEQPAEGVPAFNDTILNILDKQPVDFYFDNHGKKAALLSGWDSFLANRYAAARSLYGETPRFEDDEKFLPLQAADFWAWWVRHAYETNTIKSVIAGDFGAWKANNPVPYLGFELSEDDIVYNMVASLRKEIGHIRPVYDAKFFPRPSDSHEEGYPQYAEHDASRPKWPWLRRLFSGTKRPS